MLAVSQQVIDEYVFLSGRPPITEFLGFVKTLAVDGQHLDDGMLMQEWRAANDRVKELEESESGWADNPVVARIPEEMREIAESTAADESVKKTFRFFPFRIGVVELDRLVVYQKHINLRYVGELITALAAPVSPIELARFALGCGIAESQPPVQTVMPAGDTLNVVSKSADLRILETIEIDPSKIKGLVYAGRPVAIFAAIVGYGVNVLNVLDIEGRLILNNGSHRAYALRHLGVTHAPCIIQRVSRRAEIEMAGVPDLQSNPDRYLKDVRPPVLKDFFDDRLIKRFNVRRNNRIVQVKVGSQAGMTPAN